MNITIHSPNETIQLNHMNYLDMLTNIIQTTELENWAYFLEDDRAIALNFLREGLLSRVLSVSIDQSSTTTPIGYIQLQVQRPGAQFLLAGDKYHDLGISSSELYLGFDEVKEGTPLYISVVAVKKEFQNHLSILFKLIECVEEIVQQLPILPSDIYATAVTKDGQRMCQLFSEHKEPLSSTTRVVCFEGIEYEHSRTLYQFESKSFLEKVQRIKRKQST
jgi:hypothetical protein